MNALRRHVVHPSVSANSYLFRNAVLGLLALFQSARMTGQARLVFNDDAWVRIDNGAWVVVDNPATNAVQTLGTGGNLRSEGEFNRLRWRIGNGTGAYVVPFTSAAGVKMPLTVTIAAPGSNEGTASICFSTYNHASAGIPLAQAWDNFLYMPSDVTHMNSYNAPSVPNSQNAVDRFWIIDPGAAGYAYSGLPSVVLDFTYDPGAVIGELTPGNTIGPLDQVGAQRFNSPAGLWGDMLPIGTFVPGMPSAVVGAVVPPGNFFRSWTLANFLDPLPVSLTRFGAECIDGRPSLVWSTATERNSTWFIIEFATDGQDFQEVGRVAAAGHSLVQKDYTWMGSAELRAGYFRLRMEDIDGSWTHSPVLAADCANAVAGLELVNAWDAGDAIMALVRSDEEEAALFCLYDGSGRLVSMRRGTLLPGSSLHRLDDRGTAAGMLVLRVETARAALARRVALVR